jgi:hypothetical protein
MQDSVDRDQRGNVRGEHARILANYWRTHAVADQYDLSGFRFHTDGFDRFREKLHGERAILGGAALAMPWQIHRDDPVVLLEEGHLLMPGRFVTGPAMDENDRLGSAAAYGRMDGDAIHRGGRRQHGKGKRKERQYRAHKPHYIAPHARVVTAS